MLVEGQESDGYDGSPKIITQDRTRRRTWHNEVQWNMEEERDKSRRVRQHQLHFFIQSIGTLIVCHIGGF